MKISLIALTALLVTSLVARAQNNDRVITVNNDTIHCKIKTPGMFSGFKYSTTDSGSLIKIKENQIKEFYTADKKIWYRKIFDGNGHGRVMRVLERGTISLYELLVATNTGSVPNWYATKNSDTGIYIQTEGLIRIGTGKGKKIFATYLADNKPVRDQYIKGKFNPTIDELKWLVHWYDTGVQTAANGN